MTDVPWLTILMVVPAVGALLVGFVPGRSARRLALGISLVTLLLGIVAALQMKLHATGYQLAEVHRWIRDWGVSYALGVDGIAMSLILMSLILVPICILAAWNDVPVQENGRHRAYFALILLLEAFMVGVFAATDVFLFYLFFEAMLIPVAFLIGMYGGPGRRRAAIKFLLYSLLGGLVMLVGVLALYMRGIGGEQAFLLDALHGNLHLSPATEKLIFCAFFFAFAVKAPMVPVHTWLPEAAGESRPATATLLVGVLDKVGTFGMIRFCLELFPNASRWATPVVIVLALVSIIWGALAAIGSKDIMRMISYTSVSHFGFIILGLFAMTRVSQAGASLYMVNHGFTTAALFLLAGMLIERRGSSLIADFGGWQRVTPVLAGTMLVSLLSAAGLPGMGSFVSEFLVMMGSFERHPWHAAIAAIGVILAAVYGLWFYKRTFTGPVHDGYAPAPAHGAAASTAHATTAHGTSAGSTAVAHGGASGATAVTAAESAPVRRVHDLNGREKLVIAPLIALFLVLGFYPKPVLDALEPAVTQTLHLVGVSDTEPLHGSDVEGSHK